MHSIKQLSTAFAVTAMMLAACAPAATPTAAPPPAATEAPAAPAATEAPSPTEAPATVSKVEAPNCDYGSTMKAIEAVDELTVKFTLCTPDPAFPFKIAGDSFAILDADYLNETGGDSSAISENPVGTGPYKLKEWKRGESITYEAFADYWGDQAQTGRPCCAGRRKPRSACSSCRPAMPTASRTSGRMTSQPSNRIHRSS